MRTEAKTQLVNTPIEDVDSTIDWANEFYKAKRLEGISPATQYFYRQELGHFLKYCEAQVIDNLSDLNTSMIRNYMTWLQENGHNPGGVHAAYRVLKTFLRWYDLEAEPAGWKNPISKIKPPKLSEELLEPVDLKIVTALLATCDQSFLGKRNRAIFLFLLDTGLRARELLSLNLADVNEVTGAVLLKVGKGRKPRTVVISRGTIKAVRGYLRMRSDNLAALWVTDDRTTNLKYGALRKVLLVHSRAAKVPLPTAHSFRRAFALTMLRNGVDLMTLARLMGHTSLIVLRRYLKQIDQDLQEAHAKGSPVEHGL